MRRQLARPRSREIALMHAHGRADDLGREVEEIRIETAQQRHGPFDHAGDFLEQAQILDQLQPALRADRSSTHLPFRRHPAAAFGPKC